MQFQFPFKKLRNLILIVQHLLNQPPDLFNETSSILMVSRPSVSRSSRSSRLPLIVNLDGFSPVRLVFP